jgi:trigger factor
LIKSIEDINATKKRLRIEIPSDVIEREIGGSLEKLRHSVKLPGFRPGKAPINLIEKRFGKDVEAEVLDKIIPEHLTNAIREADIKPVTMPILDEEFEFKRNNPINLSFTVEVLPKIENMEYENIKIKDIPITVEEPDIEDTLKKLQDQKAIFEVADKEVEMDDLVTFEYVDSEIVSGENDSSVKELISKMGNEIFPYDLMEKVTGKKKGDIVEFTTTFDETKSKELAGKTANIKVKVSEVKKKSLPALDDEFAKDLGFANISELKEKIKEKIYSAKKEQIQKIQKAEIINKILEPIHFEVPETLLNRELESLMLEKSISGSKQGKESLDIETEILQETSEADSSEKEEKEDPEAKLKHKALRNVQASIIIDAIGQKEGITVADTEVNERISFLAQRLSATPEAIRNFYMYKQGSLEGLKHSIYEEKVMDLLLSKASIEREENK